MTSAAPEPLLPDSIEQRTPRLRRPDRRRVAAVARRGWLAVALLTMILSLIGEVANYQFHQALGQYDDPGAVRENLAHLGLSVNAYAAYLVALGLIFTLACFAVGTIIGLRRSDRPMALFVSSLLILQGATLFNAIYALGERLPILSPVAFVLGWLAFVTVFVLLLVFPDGRFTPPWTRWLVVLAVAWWLLPVPDSIWVALVIGFATAMLVIGVAAQIHRYRRISDDVERGQTRLVALGVAIAIFAWVLMAVLSNLFSWIAPGTLAYLVGETIATVCLLCIPAAFGIAIMRYHLWDIDLIINRTLVYVSLTALLAGLYASLAPLFQRLVGAKSFPAALLTTIVVAAAVTPLKNSVQALVDQHVKVAPRAVRPVLGSASGGPAVDPGTAGSESVIAAQDARIEELHGEIAELKAELSSRAAAEYEVRELRELLARLEMRLSAASGNAPASRQQPRSSTPPPPPTAGESSS